MSEAVRISSGFAVSGLHINGGRLSFDSEECAEEDLDAGLKLAILLEGNFDLGVAGGAPIQMRGSTASLFVGRDAWRLDHRFGAGAHIRFLTIHLAADLIADELDLDVDDTSGPHSVTMFSAATPSAMTAITQQILLSPYSGAAAGLHLAGKGLELAALAIDRFVRGDRPASVPLATPAETRRLHEIREWLESNHRDAPTLDRLARQAGMNVRKLTSGFRRLFGMSVAEYLRDVRLREAHRLLAGGCSATEAAEQVGYTLPHFTVAFRQRYGITPGVLVGRDPVRSLKI